jgi:hypothetical protein
MECPHLAGVFMKYCVAENETYVPSVYEMREYCVEPQHRVCRHYMQSDKSSGNTENAPLDSNNMHTFP